MNRYKKGANFERKIVNEARAKGLIAFRSAGSHSPIDLVIIDTPNKTIRFVQCKKWSSKLSQTAKDRILTPLNSLNAVFSCSIEIIE